MTVDLTKVAPWAPDTPTLLTQTLSHTAEASVVMPSGETITLDLKSGTIGFDETRAPRAQANLVCRVPTDQATLDRIDPRTGARLVIDAGYVRPDQLRDVQPMVNLGLRTRSVRRPDDTMTLAGSGDEALVIDNAPSAGGSVVETNTINGIATTIRTVFPGLSFDFAGTAGGPALNQAPIGDKWELVSDLANRVDAQVYDNGLRAWFIKPQPVIATPALELVVGTNGTLTESDTGLSRDDGFYNRAFVTYRWVTTSGGVDTQRTIVSVRSVNSGPYAATTGNVRTLEITKELPATQTEADTATAALVKRLVTRGRSFNLTAVSAYWLRPGMTVTVQLPLGDAEDHLVSAVVFDLATGLMRVTTRLPDGTYTIGA